MIRKGIRPGLKFGLNRPMDGEAWRREFPFRRSWPAIAVLAVFDAVFLFPAITTARQIGGFSGFESLFDVVIAVFLSAWLLGWSMAPLIMTTILLLMLFGREVLKVGPGKAELYIGLPFVGAFAQYEVSRMRNLRVEQPAKKSGKSWRGSHLVFDYGANSIGFGSDLGPVELGEIESSIRMASGESIRKGEATPEELENEWEPVPKMAPVEALAEPVVAEPPKGWLTPSSLMLIAANLVPVAGAVFFGWNLSDVMVIYWAESAVVGLFNLAKIIRIGRWAALFAGPFFLGHFGGFMAVHFLFIYSIFVEGVGGEGPAGDLSNVFALFVGLWPALLALLLSHGYSFFANFLGQREYEGRTVSQQMSEPYSRIIFMHLVLIFGGGLALVMGEPTFVLLIVIALKIFFDVKAHAKQRSGGKETSNEA
jgi:hypothetical protein